MQGSQPWRIWRAGSSIPSFSSSTPHTTDYLMSLVHGIDRSHELVYHDTTFFLDPPLLTSINWAVSISTSRHFQDLSLIRNSGWDLLLLLDLFRGSQVVRTILHPRLHSVDGRLAHFDLQIYHPRHPSGAFEITTLVPTILGPFLIVHGNEDISRDGECDLCV